MEQIRLQEQTQKLNTERQDITRNKESILQRGEEDTNQQEQPDQPDEQASSQITNDKPFSCRRCPAKYASNTRLHHHIRAHHPKPSQPSSKNYSCRRCYSRFSSNSQLHQHLRDQHGKHPPPPSWWSNVPFTASSSSAPSFSTAARIPASRTVPYAAPASSQEEAIQPTPPTRTPLAPSSTQGSVAPGQASLSSSFSQASIAATAAKPAAPPVPWWTKPNWRA